MGLGCPVDRSSRPSIHELPPLETGGEQARKGFFLQDHVAAGFCIDMLEDDTLAQVWCESQDDVTLIWQRGGKQEEVEFVQVKSDEPDQLWTVARLCSGKSGSSVLEKSLQYDRCKEQRSFRLVTSWPVSRELRPLEMPFGSPGRVESGEELAQIGASCAKKLTDCLSPNGNDCRYWVERCLWQVVGRAELVEVRNKQRLRELLEKRDMILLKDQLNKVYRQILHKVQLAALAPGDVDPSKKKIRSGEFETWLFARIAEATAPPDTGGVAVRRKMQAAGIAEDLILTADEQRLAYRAATLSPAYHDLTGRGLVERETTALLHRLRARLDSGAIADGGPQFHDRCLQGLVGLRDSLPLEPKPSAYVVDGFMYYTTDRCRHRFLPEPL